MDRSAEYRSIIRRILTEYASIPYSHGNMKCEVVFDEVLPKFNYKAIPASV